MYVSFATTVALSSSTIPSRRRDSSLSLHRRTRFLKYSRACKLRGNYKFWYNRAMSHISQIALEELRGALEAEKDSLEEELASHGRVQSDSGDWQGASVGFEG